MIRCIVAGVLALLVALPANAQSFYEGKTITIVTSTGVGGTYDVTARLISRHMPRFIPGKPTMVVQNMPGGGNVLATNFMYTIAPKDGTRSPPCTTPCRCIRYSVGRACGSMQPNSNGSAPAERKTK